jgi:DNA repair protein RadD
MKARDYQTFAVDSVFSYFSAKHGNPLIAMPTGTGKSVVIALFLRMVYQAWPMQKVLVLTHVKELIEQNHAKLKALWPEAPAGVYSAGLGKRDTKDRIIFAGVGSVAKRAEAFGKVDLIMIDECHLVSPSEQTMYQSFIAALKVTNPLLKVIGLTATPWRLGHGKLIDDGGLFTDICCDMTSMDAFNWLIHEGYLVTLVPKRTTTMLDVDGVHMRGGEFIASELQGAVDKRHVTEAAVKEMIELGSDRHSWLVFCAGVEHAEHTSDLLNDYGITCAAVHSKMTGRDEKIRDWKAGKLRALTNNNVLTTGIDHPHLDLIGMLRPTASPVLWVQMLGRGTRPVYADGFDVSTKAGRLGAIQHSTKRNCLVLDFARNTRRLGPINDPVIPRKKGDKGGEAPVKLCEHCGIYNHASVRICSHCGSPFPEVQLKIQASAGTEQLIKMDVPVVERTKVDHVTLSLHTKTGRPTMVRVMYYCGLRTYSEFVCVEHDSYAGRKAREWWQQHAKHINMPATSMEMIECASDITMPTHLEVWTNKKYPEIMRKCFDGTNFGTEASTTQAPGVSKYQKSERAATVDFEDDDIPF